jgi:hypothetical protein
MVELGRVDICIEVSMMSSHLALPRAGHLKEVLHIFAYLKKHHNSEMVFDPTPVEFDRSLFERQDWSFSQYGCEEMVEELPDGMPIPLGQSMTMRVYVDSDHAGDMLTRRSRTGYVARLSHTHPLFKSDNGQVFDVIEAALRGTSISPSIAQFRKTRDGRAAYLALVSQHAGRDVWDKLQREAEHKLQNVKWNGQTTITLQQHMSMHRREWITLQDCSEYIPVEVPNGRQRVTWLMNSITSIDPGVLAAIAAVRQDEADKRVNFESAVAYLAPVCPVAAKQQRRGKLEANVSGTTAGGLGSTGKTGVSLRYHKYAEFQKLSEEQKKELREWKTNNKTNGKRKSAPAGDKKATKKMKGMLAAFSAANTEAIQALVDSNSATVAAVAAGMGSTMGTQPKGAIGSVTTVTPTKTPAELMLAAEVAALKLKSILKGGESKDKKKSD